MQSGMGLAEVSARSGVSKAALSQWENGNRSPLGPSLERLLGVLQAPFRLQARLLDSTDPVHARIALIHNPLGPPVDMGQILKGLRLRARMTQSELARAIGLTQGAVAKWENGENIPSTDALHAALFALQPSVEEVECLLSAHIPTPSNEIVNSLEERLHGLHFAPSFRLVEVGLDLVQRDAWRAATLTESADHVLVEVMAWKAAWLIDNERFDEAAAIARQAIRLGKKCGNWDMAALAATYLAQCVTWGQGDDVVLRVRKNLADWLDKPLTRYWRGWVMIHCGALSERLDDVDAMERWGLAALDQLAEYRALRFAPPYVGLENAIDLIAYSEVRRGFPDKAIETLSSIPDIESRGYFCLPGTALTYLRALADMGKALPIDTLDEISRFKESFSEYPVRWKEWQVVERYWRRYLKDKK